MARKLNSQPAGTGGDGRQLSPTDNLSDADKRRAREEADQVQLLSGISQLRPLMDKAAVLKAQYDEAKSSVTNFRKVLCGQISMSAEDLDGIMSDQTAVRRDVVAREESRAYFRRLAGQPVGRSEEQIELDERLPPVERDIAHWRGDGFAAGLRASDPVPPEECPGAGDMQQAWMTGWHEGQTVNAMALQKAAPKPPAPEPEKEETPYMRKKRERAEQEAVLAGLEKLADQIIEDGEPTEAEDPETTEPEAL